MGAFGQTGTQSSSSRLLAKIYQYANAVERRCWIPSTDGKNFTIRWDLIKRRKRERLGLDCELWLDGIYQELHLVLVPSDISEGTTGSWDTVCDNEGRERPFLFGKLNTTDREDLAPKIDERYKDLHTIKLKLSWIHDCKKQYEDSSSEDSGSESGEDSVSKRSSTDRPGEDSVHWVHEEAALKGHGVSAVLGPPFPVPSRATTPVGSAGGDESDSDREFRWDYKVASSPPPSWFIFRYAPRDWLKNRKIGPQRLPIPVVDLTSLREQTSPIPTPSRMKCPQPAKVEPLVRPAKPALLRQPQDQSRAVGGVDPIDLAMEQLEEEQRLPSLTEPHQSELASDEKPSRLSVPLKRGRKSGSPPTIDLISSDEEPVLLDIKPSKRIRIERPQIKHEDSKSDSDMLKTDIHGSATDAIDPWRLGC